MLHVGRVEEEEEGFVQSQDMEAKSVKEVTERQVIATLESVKVKQVLKKV